MKKRLISVLFVLLMIVVTIGCSDKTAQIDNTVDNNSVNQTVDIKLDKTKETLYNRVSSNEMSNTPIDDSEQIEDNVIIGNSKSQAEFAEELTTESIPTDLKIEDFEGVDYELPENYLLTFVMTDTKNKILVNVMSDYKDNQGMICKIDESGIEEYCIDGQYKVIDYANENYEAYFYTYPKEYVESEDSSDDMDMSTDELLDVISEDGRSIELKDIKRIDKSGNTIIVTLDIDIDGIIYDADIGISEISNKVEYFDI